MTFTAVRGGLKTARAQPTLKLLSDGKVQVYGGDAGLYRKRLALVKRACLPRQRSFAQPPMKRLTCCTVKRAPAI